MNFTTRNPSFINKKPTSISAGDSAGITMWIKQRQSEAPINSLVWGRIRDTGINYIVEGYQQDANEKSLVKWVKIPCRRLLDARLLLGSVMSPLDFDLAKIGQ